MMLRGTADDVELDPGSVQAIVTSPPYWGRRRYGDDPAELGREDLIEYVRRLTLIFRRLRPALSIDGLLWVNIGDTAAGSGGAGGDHSTGSKRHMPKYRQGSPRALFPVRDEGLFPEWRVMEAELRGGNWCLVPWLLAWHLQGDGWLLRKTIVWDKGRRRPEDLAHVRRPGEAHEYVLMLARSRSYKWRPGGLVEPGDVWHFAPGSTVGAAHFAPFPDELAERCILPSTDPGELVFDPFAGSGTVPRVAERLGRRGLGVDLYAELGEAEAG